LTKGFTKDGKFHPITDYKKGIRKSRDQQVKQQGVKVERKARAVTITDMDDFTLDLRIESLQDEVQRRTALEQTGVPNSDIAEIKKMLMTAQLEKRKRIANPETQSQLSEHIVQIINKSLPSTLSFAYKTSNIRGIEKKSSNKWIFTVVMQSHDAITVGEIVSAGFKAIEINDVLDTRHATFEGDLGLG
jgi:hypothetical protein